MRSQWLPGMAFLALVACGGGGSGGGGGSLSIMLAQDSLSWTYFQGVTPQPQTLTANVAGTYSGTIYVLVTIENQGAVNAIDPNIPLDLSPTHAIATILPMTGLSHGSYTGRLKVLVCSDSACTHAIGGTPLYANFSVTVRQSIETTPPQVDVTATSGTQTDASLAVTLGEGATDFTVVGGANIADVTAKSSNSLSLRMRSLPVGSYQSFLLLSDGISPDYTLRFNYVVNAPAGGQHGLSTTASGLTFTAGEGGGSVQQFVQVTEPSWQPGLITSADGWIDVAPVAGGYMVSVNAANLRAGTYSGAVVISPYPLPSGVQDPYGVEAITLPVALTVGTGIVQPADASLILTPQSTAAALSGAVTIAFAAGTPPETWYATPGAGWLSVTPSGQPGDTLAYTIDPGSMPDGPFSQLEQVAQVVVRTANPLRSLIMFNVRVTPALARVNAAGPTVQVSGKPVRVTVTGSGFLGLADPASAFTVQGATVAAATRLSDSRMLLDLDSLPAGLLTVNVHNQLPITGPVAYLQVVPALTYSYATVPTAFAVTALITDDERGGLYAVTSGQQLVEFAPGTGAWTTRVAALDRVINAGLIQGGGLFVETQGSPGGPDLLHVVSRTTLTDTALITSPQRFVVPLADRAGIPVTSDARNWIATTSDACAGVDSILNNYGFPAGLAPATLAGAPADSCGQYFGGLDLQADRNGDRVLLAESGSSFPASGRQPLSFVETATNALVTSDSASSGVYGWVHSATSSFDGQRLIFDMEFLLDGNGNRIGTVRLPDFGTPQSPTFKQVAVLAPRGDRAYVLAGQVQASALRPRVYVVDTSAPAGGSLPLLGYFELADVPSGCLGTGPCDIFPPAALSLDGSTLFIAGSDLLVVAPIPTTLVPAAAASLQPVKRVAPRAWSVASP